MQVLVTGVLGIVAGCKKTKCSIVAFLVLSILSSITVVIVDLIIFVSIENNSWYYDKKCPPSSGPESESSDEEDPECRREQAIDLALKWCMGVSGLIEIFAVIWASSLASTIVCCTKAADQTAVTSAYYLNPSSQVVLMEQPGQERIYAPEPSSRQPGVDIPMIPMQQYPEHPPAYSNVQLLPSCPSNDCSDHTVAL